MGPKYLASSVLSVAGLKSPAIESVALLGVLELLVKVANVGDAGGFQCRECEPITSP